MLTRVRTTKVAVAVVAAALVLPLVTLQAGAAPPPATMIGKRYDDGLDSRLSALRVSQALNNLGYASSSYAGRSAADAWEDGLSAAVFGVFGHGNAGIVQTDEGPTDARDEILAAGDLTYLSGRNYWFWGNYLHYLDVDDMRLAIFAGCYTGNVDVNLGSFGNVGEERGVDSIVGFTELVYYPAFCTNCEYSGNYFWSRFAAYVEAGDTVGVALSKARSDLTALEGNAGGWHSWKLDGAVDRPGDIRLKPASASQSLNSRPFGIDPFDLLDLDARRSREDTVGGRRVVDRETAQGVTYRVDAATGDLLWLAAPASVRATGARLSDAEARARAEEFTDRHARFFDAAGGIVTESAPRHEDGDDLYGFQWRPRTAAGAGPAVVEVEVDRRTGAVTYFAAATASGSAGPLDVDRRRAVAAARAALPDGAAATVVAAATDEWTAKRWVVVLDRGGSRLTPDFARVVVDGRTGQVLSTSAT